VIGGAVDGADVTFSDGIADNFCFSGFGEERESPGGTVAAGEVVAAGEAADISGFFDSSALLHPIVEIKTAKKSNRKILTEKNFFTLY
jgi:hypothetical protein